MIAKSWGPHAWHLFMYYLLREKKHIKTYNDF